MKSPQPILEQMDEAARLRFWAKVRQGSPEECWPYGRGTGYGMVALPGGYASAHRIAWALYTEQEPGDHLVCHHCDNPPCCNPAHLFLGTHTDNMRDCVAKGRRRNQAEPSAEYLPIAEAARQLGVSKQTVYRWMEQGYLPAYHRGPGKYGTYVRIADLDALQTFQPKTRD